MFIMQSTHHLSIFQIDLRKSSNEPGTTTMEILCRTDKSSDTQVHLTLCDLTYEQLTQLHRAIEIELLAQSDAHRKEALPCP